MKPKFSKKTYELVADGIRDAIGNGMAKKVITYWFIVAFCNDNPKFNREKFVERTKS